jgi:hypothetical protein
MAGSDQSVNLSGMLGQIAETTGSMGDAYSPVLKAATKPRGDMNDPQHLRNLAQWASSNGDSAMASQYMQEARRISAERTAANEKVVKEAKDRAVNTAVSSYNTALKSGDPDKIQAAYEEAVRVGNDTGRTTINAITQLEGAQRQRDEAAYVAGQRQKKAAEEGFIADFGSKITGDMTAEELQKKADAVAPQFKEQAQTLASRQIQFNNQVAKDKERNADLSTPVDTDFASSSIEAIKDPEVRAAYTERLTQLEKPDGWDGETWATQTQRRRHQTLVDALAEEAFRAGTGELVNAQRAERERAENIANGAAVVARQAVSNADIEAWKTANPDKDVRDSSGFWDLDKNNISYAEVKKIIRQERMDGYYAGLGLDNPNADNELTDEELLTKY